MDPTNDGLVDHPVVATIITDYGLPILFVLNTYSPVVLPLPLITQMLWDIYPPLSPIR